MHFNANAPAGTQAYAVTISDRLIKFQSDGNKMSVDLSFFFLYETDEIKTFPSIYESTGITNTRLRYYNFITPYV